VANQTDRGTLQAEHVVNAAGLWAREVGTWSASSCRSCRWSIII
jgi:glycine/D-amino acid oxidase-like deaminating enzyme